MPESFSPGAPADYDDSLLKTVSADPAAMYDQAHVKLPPELDAIVACWNTIGNAWEGLKLSWAGQSAEAAQAFNDRLQNVQAELFGVDDDTNPKPGILGLIRAVALQAATNYDNAEHQVEILFRDFGSALQTGGGSGGGSPQNTSDSPISITYGPVG